MNAKAALYSTLLLIMLPACREISTPEATRNNDWVSDNNTREISALKERVALLESASEGSMFKLSNEGFGYVRSSLGSVPFVWKESVKRGSGTQLTLEIGNTTNADWHRFEIFGLYGELNADGSVKEGSAAPLVVESSVVVKSGR